ncbi:MAG TPA: nucleotidyltransferase domain-containing protein [Rhizomicrobium sp.]|nr:nucleotidyltransferase domain-containing protein [Rhizomicrobium sp.]
MTSQSSIAGIVARVAARLAPVTGVRAVALGGSRARGWHNPHSDVDIGLYYDGAAGLDVAALNEAATALDDGHRADLATGPGGWGAWVDGGAWLRIEGVAVDLIYRDLARVDRAIAEAEHGEFQIAYHAGHPHGFVSTFYAAEIAVGAALHDPRGLMAARKARLAPYPETLSRNATRRFLGEARFSLGLLEKAAHAGDPAYAAGVAFRIVACLAHALFALNRQWLMNEKGAVRRVESFPLHPRDFAARVAEIFAAPGGDLAALVSETAALAAPPSC